MENSKLERCKLNLALARPLFTGGHTGLEAVKKATYSVKTNTDHVNKHHTVHRSEHVQTKQSQEKLQVYRKYFAGQSYMKDISDFFSDC